MTDPAPSSVSSSALRRIRAQLLSPAVLLSLAGIALLLTISGPFRTLETLGLPLRALYWTGVVTLAYATGVSLTILVIDGPPLARQPLWLRIGAGALLIGICVTAELILLGALVQGDWPVPGPDWAANLAIAILVSALLLGLETLTQGNRDTATPAPATPIPGAATLLARLPLDRRGRLLALSAEDHYVRILTDRGSDLILMRLADAIALAGIDGLQIHRSHWIARDAVAQVRRTGEPAVVTLQSGDEIPASRRYIPDLRTAGLLPGRPAEGRS